MLLLLALVGLALGGVMNALADDLPPDEFGVRRTPRRPHCRRCWRAHQPLYWLGLAGALLRTGRCEHCGGRRRLRPVLLEAATALALPYLWLWAGGDAARFAAAALIVLPLMLVTVIDMEHRLILRVVILPTAALFLLVGWLSPGMGLAKSFWGGLAGYGIMFAIFLLAEVYAQVVGRLRGQPLDEVVLGGGDVNLAAAIGFAVGWPGVLLALVIAILAGGVFALGLIAVQLARRRYSPHMVMPYGPFLVLGGLAIYLYGRQVAAWYLAGG